MATLPADDRSTSITVGSSTAGPFLVGFRLFSNAALKVYVDDEIRTDYTVSAVYTSGYSDTASITFTSALSAGEALRIEGHTVPDRQVDYLPGEAGLTGKVNADMGRQVAVLQELRRDADRGAAGLDRADEAFTLADRAYDLALLGSTAITLDEFSDLLTYLAGDQFPEDPEGTTYRVNGVDFVKATGVGDFSSLPDITISGQIGYPRHVNARGNSDGTSGDGNDDTVPLQELLDWHAARPGRKIVADPGEKRYRITSALTCATSADIDLGTATIFPDGDFTAFNFVTPHEGKYALTADYVPGALTLAVASTGTALKAGRLIKIVSDADAPWDRDKGSSANRRRVAEWFVTGEGSTTTSIVLAAPLRFIEGVSPTVVSGDEALISAYTTAMSAQIVVPGDTHVRITGGAIEYEEGKEATYNAPAAKFAGQATVEIRGLRIPRGYSEGVSLKGVRGGVIEPGALENLENNTSLSQFGYGISFGGTYGVTIQNATFANGRHGVTSGATQSSTSVATETSTEALLNMGQAQAMTIAHCTAYGFLTTSAYDLHHNAVDTVFDNCAAYNCAGYGFTNRGRNTTYINPIAINCNGGIYNFTEQDSGDPDDDLFTASKLARHLPSCTIINPNFQITARAGAENVAIRNANGAMDIQFTTPVRSSSVEFILSQGVTKISGTPIFFLDSVGGAAPLYAENTVAAIRVDAKNAAFTDLGNSLIIETGADMRVEMGSATATGLHLLEVASGASAVIRGKVYAEVPSVMGTLLEGAGTIRTADDGLIEYAVLGADDNTISVGETNRNVRVISADGRFAYGGLRKLEFTSRAAAIAALSWMYLGQEFQIGALDFVYDGTGTNITDMSGASPANGSVADARHFGTINTSTSTNDTTLAAAFAWLNAADSRVLYLPPGNIPIATTLTIRGTGKYIWGNGTQMVRTNSGDFFIFGDGSGATTYCDIEGVRFQVNGTPGATDKAIKFHNAVDCKIVRCNGSLAGMVEWGNATYTASRCDLVDVNFRMVAASVGVTNEYFLMQACANIRISGVFQQGSTAANGKADAAILRMKPLSGKLVDTVAAPGGFQVQSYLTNTPSASADGIPYGIVIDMTDGPVTNVWFDEMSNVDQTTTAALHIFDDAASTHYARDLVFNLRMTPAAGRAVLIDKQSTDAAAVWAGWSIGGYLPVRGGVESISISGEGFLQCSIEHARIGHSESGGAIDRAILLNSDDWTIRNCDIGRNVQTTSRFTNGIEIGNADIVRVHIEDNTFHPEIAVPVKVPASWTTADKDAPGRVISIPGRPAFNSTTATIASGAITAHRGGFIYVDTESAAASDDLDTITGQVGGMIVLRAANDARTVVAKDGTGNLRLNGDFSLTHSDDTLTLAYDGAVWVEISRSDNAA